MHKCRRNGDDDDDDDDDDCMTDWAEALTKQGRLSNTVVAAVAWLLKEVC